LECGGPAQLFKLFAFCSKPLKNGFAVL